MKWKWISFKYKTKRALFRGLFFVYHRMGISLGNTIKEMQEHC